MSLPEVTEVSLQTLNMRMQHSPELFIWEII